MFVVKNRSRVFFSLIVCINLILICLCSNPVDQSQNDAYSIALTGHIFHKDGTPFANVIVRLTGKNMEDTTDQFGLYQFLAPDNDTAKKMNSQYGSVDSIKISKDGQIITSLNVTRWIDTLPDIYIVQHNIYGKFTDTNMAAQSVTARLNCLQHSNMGDSTQTKSISLLYNQANNSFSGFVYLVYSNEIINYSLIIEVLNKDNVVIGRSQSIVFPSTAGNIEIPEFSVFNQYPKITRLFDSTVFMRDSFTIHIEAADLNGSIEKYLWALNGSDFFDSTLSPSIKTAYEYSGLKVIPVKAIDNDGLVSEIGICSITVVEPDTTKPVIILKGRNPDTTSVDSIRTYFDEGVTAYDVVNEQKIDLPVSISGKVNRQEPGTYKITYTAVDAAGLTTEVTRTVVAMEVPSNLLLRYGVPGTTPLNTINQVFSTCYVEGTDVDAVAFLAVSSMTINWVNDESGQYLRDFSIHTFDEPYIINLVSSVNSFKSNQPSVTLTGTVIPDLNRTFWVTVIDDEMIWVEESGKFAIIWRP